MIYYAIPLRAKLTSRNWNEDILNLENTLISIAKHEKYKAIIACHDIPEIPNIERFNVEFIQVSLGIPNDKNGYMADKGSKKKVARQRILEIAEVNDYFMYLDADDLLHNDFFEIINKIYIDNKNVLDIVFFTGYVYDVNRKLLAYLDGYKKIFYRNCGSCFVSKITQIDLIDRDDSFLSSLVSHTDFPIVSLKKGRSIYSSFVPVACYMVNHGSNDATIRVAEGLMERFVDEHICQNKDLIDNFSTNFNV